MHRLLFFGRLRTGPLRDTGHRGSRVIACYTTNIANTSCSAVVVAAAVAMAMTMAMATAKITTDTSSCVVTKYCMKKSSIFITILRYELCEDARSADGLYDEANIRIIEASLPTSVFYTFGMARPAR